MYHRYVQSSEGASQTLGRLEPITYHYHHLSPIVYACCVLVFGSSVLASCSVKLCACNSLRN